MSLPKPDHHVRLQEETNAAFVTMATLRGTPVTTLISHACDLYALGHLHALKIATEKAQRLGLFGTEQED